MDAQHRIQILAVLRVGNRIHQILHRNAIILIPNQTHLVIIGMHTACIVRHIPSTSQMLREPRHITPVRVHQPKVTIRLQQGCRQLRIRIERRSLRPVRVQVSHITVTAGRQGSSHTQHHQTSAQDFLHIYFHHNLHFLLSIKTLRSH